MSTGSARKLWWGKGCGASGPLTGWPALDDNYNTY